MKPRPSGRKFDELRKIEIIPHAAEYAEGSCLISFGKTKVLCTATVEEFVPPFLKGRGEGWITAEYGMLPRSTHSRNPREAVKGKQGGRTVEIQRLIGRSLRAVADTEKLGERQITIDCDVLNADGGTRTASITGGYVALYLACKKLKSQGRVHKFPIIDSVAAVSCGIYNGQAVLDLDYSEDSKAEADANFVLTGSGKIIEIQATAEEFAFEDEHFTSMFKLAKKGIAELVEMQKGILEV
jgi:ribonuclease PH